MKVSSSWQVLPITMPRASLQGEPSGLRIHVPLAGMPLKHGIRNSGQLALPAWASFDQRPADWTPPEPSFGDDTVRIRELLRLLHTLKQIPEVETASFPQLYRLEDVEDEEEWSEDDVSSLWPELDIIEGLAAQRSAWLQRIRASLHGVAHGELGVRHRPRTRHCPSSHCHRSHRHRHRRHHRRRLPLPCTRTRPSSSSCAVRRLAE